MDKPAVRVVLEQIAASLALKGDNPFRIRAFENAARAIAGYPGDLGEALQSTRGGRGRRQGHARHRPRAAQPRALQRARRAA